MQESVLWSPLGPARRPGRRPPRIAAIERLEERMVLDSGTGAGVAAAAAVVDVARPSRFATADEFRQYLIDAAVAQWRSVLGQRYPRFPDGPGIPDGQDALIASPDLARTTALAADAPSFSGTNNQVAGVDEGDIVETDGRFLYILSGRSLKIVDARRPDALAIASATDLGGYAVAEHLNGTRLTVISTVDDSSNDPRVFEGGDVARIALVADSFVYAPPKLKVTEFDVADPAAPRVLRTTTFDGSYIQSRAVGDLVRVVVQHHLDALPPPEVRTTDDESIYPTEEEYRAQLEAIDITATLPRLTSAADGPGGHAEASGPLLDFDAIYRPTAPEDRSLLAVVTFDAADPSPGPAGAVGVVAPYGSTVYATADHLYLAGTRWDDSDDGTSRATTAIQQFTLDGASATLTAVGTVPGTVLNQFALDEHEGHLRVATTSDWWDGTTLHTTNSLTILAEQDGALVPVGNLTDLAPGERIFAARFFGDRAFLVTFRQVDPLFALDLSDPTAPRAVGELKIPGFSTYLHPVDATHVIGIGRDADPDTGRARGLQVSLFDVADLANPVRVDVETIAVDGYVWSEAEYEHHAVSFFPESGVLAIPVNIQTNWDWDGTGEPPAPRYELWSFRVDVEEGLTPLGQVAHETPVVRSVNVDDVLFSISFAAVRATPVLDPGTTLGQVVLNAPGDDGGYWPGGPFIDVRTTIDLPGVQVDPLPVDPLVEPTIDVIATPDPGVDVAVTSAPAPPAAPAPAPAVASIPMPLGEGFRRGGRRPQVGRRRLAATGQAVPRPSPLNRPLHRDRQNGAGRRALQARLGDAGQPLVPAPAGRLEAGFRRLLARRLGPS